MSVGFVHEHKPAHNKSIIIIHAKPTTLLMDTKPYLKPWLVLNLTWKWISEVKNKKLIIYSVTGCRSECHFLFWQACHQNSILYDGGVFAHCSLIMSHLTAVLIPLYEWQRFPKKLDCVPLSPLPPHKSFLKRAISSYLYTLIICAKGSYLNHLHCWLATSPRPTRFSSISSCRVALCMYFYTQMQTNG